MKRPWKVIADISRGGKVSDSVSKIIKECFAKVIEKIPSGIVIDWVCRISALFAVFSLGFEFFTNHSIAEYLCNVPFVKMFIRDFLFVVNADAIKAVVDGIGLSSVVITYVYTERNNRELSISYLSLAYQIQPDYKLLVLRHYVLVLCCFWTVNAKMLELSVLLLIIILCGCIKLFNVLELLLLSPEKRQEKAVELLTQQTEPKMSSDNFDLRLRNVYQVVNQIANADYSILGNMYDLLLKRWSSLNSTIIGEAYNADQMKFVVRISANIWAKLLRNRLPEEHSVVANEVISRASGFEITDNMNVRVMYAGYVLWLCEHFSESEMMDSTRILEKMRVEIEACLEHLEKISETAKHDIRQTSIAIHWMFFLTGRCSTTSVLDMPALHQIESDEQFDAVVKAVLEWCTEQEYQEYIDHIVSISRPAGAQAPTLARGVA